MGLLGVALVWGGYAVFVYGLELVKGKCTPLRRIMWPAGATAGDISVACPKSSTATSAPPAKAATPANTPYNVKQALKGNPNYVRDYLSGTGPYKGEPLGPSEIWKGLGL